MPGKTTYYSRVQAMLELAGARSSRSREDFIKSIVRRSPPNFVYHRWDPQEEEIRPRCSRTAIERTFELAVELGLLHGDSGILTNVGKEAADPGHYDSILRRRVRLCLQQLGCPVARVTKVCLEMMRRDKVILPTVDELHLTVCVEEGLDVSAAKFGTLLRLLAAAGGIMISRRHIFLPKGA